MGLSLLQIVGYFGVITSFFGAMVFCKLFFLNSIASPCFYIALSFLWRITQNVVARLVVALIIAEVLFTTVFLGFHTPMASLLLYQHVLATTFIMVPASLARSFKLLEDFNSKCFIFIGIPKLCLSLGCIITGLYFFTLPDTRKTAQPWVSRSMNRKCVYGQYSSHDVWHFVGAFGLFFHSAFLLTLHPPPLVFYQCKLKLTLCLLLKLILKFLSFQYYGHMHPAQQPSVEQEACSGSDSSDSDDDDQKQLVARSSTRTVS